MDLSFHHPAFERAVRERLHIWDRAITDTDAHRVTELDLTDFDADIEDFDTLLHFDRLKVLCIETPHKDPKLWKYLSSLEELFWVTWNGPVDFSVFSNMTKLTRLTVSGGSYSNITLKNLAALIPLKRLRHLELHEFGSVDLAPLGAMTQLRSLAVRYSYEVKHIAVIGDMPQLEKLTLDGLSVDDLDFLDTLPDHLTLTLCGIRIPCRKAVNLDKWKRFTNRDICEIQVNSSGAYLDLSALHT